MFLTNILLKKAKSKVFCAPGLQPSNVNIELSSYTRRIMVLMESVVSGHKFNTIRERLSDKLELIRFDPYIQKESLYKERKKIRSMKT